MGWFPGYAIDLETGARLYMAFGENSFLGGENGADMIWNPTSNLVSNVGTPLMGGVHPIYIYSKDQKTLAGGLSGTLSSDLSEYIPGAALNDANHELRQRYELAQASPSTTKIRDVYAPLTWVFLPNAQRRPRSIVYRCDY
jgi:hypothetical protein